MSLRHGLLGLLNYGDNTGYELNRIFKHSLNFFWQAHASQIYRELSLLEERGFLKSTIVNQSRAPNKKVYAITRKGKSELRRWLREDTELEGRNSFLMKLFFAGEIGPEGCLEMLTAFKKENMTRLKKLSESAGGNIEHYRQKVAAEKSVYWPFVADYGKRAIQANIAWADACIASLKAMS